MRSLTSGPSAIALASIPSACRRPDGTAESNPEAHPRVNIVTVDRIGAAMTGIDFVTEPDDALEGVAEVGKARGFGG
jgi:hypothetical protein